MSDTESDERFDRMVRTDWIDLRRIHSSRVFVAGAGALGNESVKNLVLAGFRNITIADPDIVERSNLSRCVMFRERDIGFNKADSIRRNALDLDPECEITSLSDRVQSVDLSTFDVLVGCLDSISARLHMNSHARLYGVPYVDGATDGFRGKVQVILPRGPCMECFTNRTHSNEAHRVFSCDPSVAKVDDPLILSSGITTTSVIAAICVREVIKIICGKIDLVMRGLCYYDGIRNMLDLVELEISSECPNHEGEL